MADSLDTAVRLHEAGDLAGAARLYSEVVTREPHNVRARYFLGLVRLQGQDFADAERHFTAAIRLQPDFPEALTLLGLALQSLDRLPEALERYDAALRFSGNFADAHNGRGMVLALLGKHREAVQAYETAVAARPEFAEAWSNRASALVELGRFDDALACSDRALSYDAKLTAALRNRGAALLALGRAQEALDCLDRAVAREPRNPDILYLRGLALSRLGRDGDALTSFDAALAIAPEHLSARYNRANLNSTCGAYETVAADCEAVLARDPDFPYARGVLLWAKLQCCDWREVEGQRHEIASRLRDGKRVLAPHQYLAFSSSLAEQQLCAEVWARNECPISPAPLWRGEAYAHERIRVAYLSADFHAHATAYLMAGVFEQQDRSRFETFALSLGSDDNSPMRSRLRAAFDHFLDVRTLSDGEIAAKVRALEIDILVDLKGYTKGARPGALAYRAAPVQVSYLGYPGTMGLETIDYLIADRVVIPKDAREYYSERIVWLPHSYQCNDDARVRPEPPPTRQAAGLPERFVFCCFNANYKIGPQTFDSWMRILAQTKDSVLWLLAPNAPAIRNLRREAQSRGVSAERLVFAPHLDLEDHLARLPLADLVLDTWPYGAHTTASDALWMGVPVITVLGETFAGRVAASLLSAVGLPDLVTHSSAEYEALAVNLSHDRSALAAVKARLTANRTSHPLFDTTRFTRDLDAAYATMRERQRQGLAPADFAVSGDG